ncbi:MAG: protein translocase subunit SecF [Spirochaetota bacterium]
MKTIQFTKIRFLMVALSVLVIGGGLAGTLLQGGFNLGVDFQAGLSLRVGIDSPDATIEGVREALAGIEGTQVQTVGGDATSQYVIRVRDAGEIESFSAVMSGRILNALGAEFGSGLITELENTYVGPRFSEDLTRNTILLTSLALALILVYIWFRFQFGYALASIAALVHDVAFMLVIVGAFQIEVSTATIAAILTIIGYSLNDTIVIFDRIRENERLMRESGFETIINASITQSLSRTLITSITTLLAVTAIYIFATGTVQLFALNLMIGVIVGTYSSIFIASPTLLGFRRATRKRRTKQEAERRGAPVTAKTLEGAKEAAPAADAQISQAEKERVLEELRRKRAGSAGKSSSRSRRKKK